MLADGFEDGEFVMAMLKFATIVFIGAALCGAAGLGLGAVIGRIWEAIHRRRHPPRDAAEPAASRAPMPAPAPRVVVRPEVEPAVIPYLIVPGAPALIAFLHDVFGARETMRVLRSDGSVMHAEVQIGRARLMLAEASAEFPAREASVYVLLPDGDAAFARAVAAGAAVIREPADASDGSDRYGGVRDASGTLWWIASPVSATSR